MESAPAGKARVCGSFTRGECYRAERVGRVQQVLHTKQDLLDGDAGLPGLLLVENAQTHGPRWIDVGVEKACGKPALRGLGAIMVSVLKVACR